MFIFEIIPSRCWFRTFSKSIHTEMLFSWIPPTFILYIPISCIPLYYPLYSYIMANISNKILSIYSQIILKPCFSFQHQVPSILLPNLIYLHLGRKRVMAIFFLHHIRTQWTFLRLHFLLLPIQWWSNSKLTILDIFYLSLFYFLS